MFPKNTVISPGGYLIIWADGGKNKPGLHASFKLSAKGETLVLADTDKNKNAILDLVEFDKQKQDVAIGRFPDGTGNFRQVTMTPGKKNKAQ
ncbi:MAG: hypothetical protein QG663_1244 [Thermodesulfobacteriota bacterium]|nr:hypothetical protein [Thermodesulfobacteriota bacterium]